MCDEREIVRLRRELRRSSQTVADQRQRIRDLEENIREKNKLLAYGAELLLEFEEGERHLSP